VIATVERSGVSGMVKTVTEHPIFEFDVVRVDAGRWVNVGQADTYAERAIWREQ
jgi:hypothetical protein